MNIFIPFVPFQHHSKTLNFNFGLVLRGFPNIFLKWDVIETFRYFLFQNCAHPKKINKIFPGCEILASCRSFRDLPGPFSLGDLPAGSRKLPAPSCSKDQVSCRKLPAGRIRFPAGNRKLPEGIPGGSLLQPAGTSRRKKFRKIAKGPAAFQYS